MEQKDFGTLILALETATAVSSVALYGDGKLVGQYTFHTDRLHAKLISVMVERLLTDLELKPSDLDAVGMGSGPGSYTGLRVGVSVAKGLCMALDIPLLAMNSLEALAWGVQDFARVRGALICPMIDARRMEVYSAVYDAELNLVQEVDARIVEGDFMAGMLAEGPVLFVGDGVAKCVEVLEGNGNALLLPERLSSAAGWGKPLHQRLEAGRFEDLVAFEPYYLKDFVATQSKKKLI